MSTLYPELRRLQEMALNRVRKYCDELPRNQDQDSPFHAYAKDLESLTGSSDRSAASFTCQNPNYWRVLMMPGIGYLTALVSNAYVYAAHRQLSWSKVWLLLAHLELTSEFRSDFELLLTLIEEAENRIAQDIHEGIGLHDQGRFRSAVRLYDRILLEYPYSARTLYEKAYSASAEEPAKSLEIASTLLAEALRYDPFYPQAYGIKSPDEIEVFKREVQPFLIAPIKEKTDFRDFAYGCNKLGLFEIAGHAMFQLMLAEPTNRDVAFRFIVCLTEYGVDELAREITPAILDRKAEETRRGDESEVIDEIAKMQRQIKELFVAGRYREAQKAALQGLDYAKIHCGSETVEAARFLYDVGNSYLHLGDPETAGRYIQQAIKIYESELGVYETDLGYALNSLASVQMQLGQLEEAEICLRRVITIWGSKLSPRDCTLGLAYHNLGSVLVEQGRETEARKSVQRAIYILENTWVSPSYQAAPGLFRLTLAKIERHLGNLSDAFNIATEAGEILKSTLSADHPDAIRAEIELADICRDEGKFEECALHLETVLETQRRVFGSGHPHVAYTLNNLAKAYEHLDRKEESEELYLESLEMRETLVGPTHPDVATPLNNLSWLYARQKRLPEAEQLLRRALKIREQSLPANHPDLVQTLHNLGLLEIALGNYDAALGLLKRGLRLDEQLIRYRARGSNEFEKAISLTTIGQRFEVLLSLVSQRMTDSQDAVKAAFEAVINRKGLMTELLASERTVIESRSDLAKKLADATDRLASLAVRGARSLSPKDYVLSFEEAADRLQDVQIEIASAESGWVEDAPIAQTYGLETINASLSSETVLIEYVKCPMIDFANLGFGTKQNPEHYMAFVMSGGASRDILFFDLGPVEEIDALVAQYLSEMKLFASRPMSREAEKRAEKHLSDIGEKIYGRVFAPLLPAIDDAKVIYAAPDGILHVFPFCALKDQQGRYLVEQYEFRYVTTARDLLRFTVGSGRGQGICIVADPDYDKAPFELRPESESLYPIVTSLASFFVAQKWQRLSGTRKEAQAITELFADSEVHTFVGEGAREDIIKQLRSPRILHLATHGFFLEQNLLEATHTPTVSKWELVDDSSESADNRIYFEFPPLLRAGLVFAGANRCSRAPISGDVDDGILTALEVSSLSLYGTDLVVLSACETALGESYFGDSVVGLRRAFQVAGAQTLVTSLWPVPDEDTTGLMIAFYRNIRDGRGRSGALQFAALEVLNNKRQQGETTHPFYWGAFICVGNPGPMALDV